MDQFSLELFLRLVGGLAAGAIIGLDRNLHGKAAGMRTLGLVSLGAAQKKALTAVGFGMPTGKPWHDFIKDDPILLQGAPSLPDFTLLGGGSDPVITKEPTGAYTTEITDAALK